MRMGFIAGGLLSGAGAGLSAAIEESGKEARERARLELQAQYQEQRDTRQNEFSAGEQQKTREATAAEHALTRDQQSKENEATRAVTTAGQKTDVERQSEIDERKARAENYRVLSKATEMKSERIYVDTSGPVARLYTEPGKNEDGSDRIPMAQGDAVTLISNQNTVQGRKDTATIRATAQTDVAAIKTAAAKAGKPGSGGRVEYLMGVYQNPGSSAEVRQWAESILNAEAGQMTERDKMREFRKAVQLEMKDYSGLNAKRAEHQVEVEDAWQKTLQMGKYDPKNVKPIPPAGRSTIDEGLLGVPPSAPSLAEEVAPKGARILERMMSGVKGYNDQPAEPEPGVVKKILTPEDELKYREDAREALARGVPRDAVLEVLKGLGILPHGI